MGISRLSGTSFTKYPDAKEGSINIGANSNYGTPLTITGSGQILSISFVSAGYDPDVEMTIDGVTSTFRLSGEYSPFYVSFKSSLSIRARHNAAYNTSARIVYLLT